MKPFHRFLPLLALAACVTADSDDGPTHARGYVIGPGGNPMEVGYVIDGDRAIVQGDMVFALADVRALTAEMAAGGRLFGATNRPAWSRWPQGVIPFEVDQTLPVATRNAIDDAIIHWNNSGLVRLQQHNGEPDFVHFIDHPDDFIADSNVGRLGQGVQDIRVGDGCDAAVVIHEIGHAYGLWHEHSRRDRETYVEVLAANIDTTDPETDDNFEIYSDAQGADYGQYDLGSIMHYGRNFFSRNGLDTLRPRPPNANFPIGAATLLSARDRRSIWSMYAAGSHAAELVYARTGRCADVRDASRDNQGAVQEHGCNNGDNQRWIIQPTGTAPWMEIRGLQSNKCLDVPGSNPANAVQTFDCHGLDNQLWSFFRRGDTIEIRSKLGGCLLVGNTGRLIVTTCPTTVFETWWITERPKSGGHQVTNASSGECIDIPWASHNPNERLQTHACHHNNNQRWRFNPVTPPSPGRPRTYTIASVESGLCFELVTVGTTNQLQQRTCNSSLVRQRFILPVTTGGAVQIASELGMGNPGSSEYQYCVRPATGSAQLEVPNACAFGGGGANSGWFLWQRTGGLVSGGPGPAGP